MTNIPHISRSASIEELWPALSKLDPRLTFYYAKGMLGLAGITLFCSLDCVCAKKKQSKTLDIYELERIGFRADLEKESHDSGTRKRSTKRAPEDCFTLIRTAFSHKLRVVYEMSALAELAASILAPAEPYLCRGADTPIWKSTGSASFGRLASALLDETVGDSALRRTLGASLTNWNDSLDTSGRFLRDMAGARRTQISTRLRRGAECLEQIVAEALTPCVASLLQGRGKRPFSVVGARKLLLQGQHLAAEAAYHIIEAVGIGSHMAPELSNALVCDPEERLTEKAAQELIYMARSGSPSFKQLAARRMAGSEDRQTASTLRQLIYDPASPVALAAIESLIKIREDGWRQTLIRAISDMAVEPESSNTEVVAAILLYLADSNGSMSDEQMRSVNVAAQAWPNLPLISACRAKLPTMQIGS